MEKDIEIGECSLAAWIEQESALLQHLASDGLDIVIRAMRVIQSADPGRVAFARRYLGLPTLPVSALPPAAPATSRPPTPQADPLPKLPTLWDLLTDDSDASK
jgi:hypothetical protein